MEPEATYKTDEGPAYLTAIAAGFLLIPVIYMITERLYVLAGFFFFLFISAIRFFYTSRQDYTEVKVYTDHMTIGGKAGVANTIAYQDITKAGFLDSAQYVNRMDRSVKYRSEQLIILLQGNGKIELPQDLQNAHELCAIIQSRIS